MADTWPIVVGGIYKSVTNPQTITSKVTHVNDDRVYFESWYVGEGKPWHMDSIWTGSFRKLHLPENQSSIPAMTALVQKLADLRKDWTFTDPREMVDGTAQVIANIAWRLSHEAQQLLDSQAVAK